jgi:hypothetical protein
VAACLCQLPMQSAAAWFLEGLLYASAWHIFVVVTQHVLTVLCQQRVVDTLQSLRAKTWSASSSNNQVP